MPTRCAVVASAFALFTVAAFAPRQAAAQSASGAGACAAWDATYKISATLRITDTPMGAGDGTHRVGPGTLVLRFEDGDANQPPQVQLRGFELHEHFSVEPKSAFWSATIVTDSLTQATADGDGIVARGALATSAQAPTLQWTDLVRGYRSDGSLTCTGSLCGNFGAPAAGRTATHMAPHPVKFEPLRFGASGLTFDMVGYAVVAQDASPRQKTLLLLSGRAASWVCVRPRGVASKQPAGGPSQPPARSAPAPSPSSSVPASKPPASP
jgi:hypothetical protein